MRNLFIIVAVLVSLAGSSQDSLSRAKLGIEISLLRTKFNFECIFPSLVFSKGKHVVYAGPGIFYVNPDQMTPFVGAQAGYQYFPNGTKKRFSLFFEYAFNYMKGTFDDKISSSYSFYSPYGGIQSRKITMLSIDNYFCFGFSLRFLEVFYIKPVFGIGGGFYKEDYTYRFYNNDVLSGRGNLGFRYPLGINSMAKLTLGYNLVSFKKKK